MKKLISLLMAGFCVAAFSMPVFADSAEDSGTVVCLEGKTCVQFPMQAEASLETDALDAELRRAVRENVRKNRRFRYYQTVETAREAADLLGVPMLYSDVLEDMPLRSGKLQAECSKSTKVVRTIYRQEYIADSYVVYLEALTLWDMDYSQKDQRFVPDDYTLETVPCTTGTGQEVTVYYFQNEESRILRLFTVFSEGNTWYTLCAYSDGCMVRDESGDYVPGSISVEECLQVLESLEYLEPA